MHFFCWNNYIMIHVCILCFGLGSYSLWHWNTKEERSISQHSNTSLKKCSNTKIKKKLTEVKFTQRDPSLLWTCVELLIDYDCVVFSQVTADVLKLKCELLWFRTLNSWQEIKRCGGFIWNLYMQFSVSMSTYIYIYILLARLSCCNLSCFVILYFSHR